MHIIILSLAALAGAALSAVVGMAGGITLLAVMTFFLPYHVMIPVHGVVQLVSNFSRAMMLRPSIYWPVFRWFMLGLPVGTLFAVYVIKSISQPAWFLGAVVIIILYTLFKPKKMPALHLPDSGFALLGALVGFMGPLVGATGPLLAPFFLRDSLSKEQIVATKASVQFMGHLFKLPAFMYLGFDYAGNLPLIVAMSLAVIIGTRLGLVVLGKIDESVFRLLYKTALFAAALRIIYKLFS